MVIAAMPTDERHIVSLWTELECFVGSISHVVISSAYWARPIIERLLIEARTSIPHFATGKVTIEARFFDNKRYDVGLWCDGLQGLYSQSSKYDFFLLLNDSIFALREFNGILEDLKSHKDRSMNSLNYNNFSSGGYWYESVFRGFDANGLSIFRNHSCVPQTHEYFCPKENKVRRKKHCLVEHHEIGLARQFPQQQQEQAQHITKGLYSGMVPEHLKPPEQKGNVVIWVAHFRYWKEILLKQENFPAAKVNLRYWKEILLKHENFPAAKVNQLQMKATTSDLLLKNCTRYLNRTVLNDIDFGPAERTLT